MFNKFSTEWNLYCQIKLKWPFLTLEAAMNAIFTQPFLLLPQRETANSVFKSRFLLLRERITQIYMTLWEKVMKNHDGQSMTIKRQFMLKNPSMWLIYNSAKMSGPKFLHYSSQVIINAWLQLMLMAQLVTRLGFFFSRKKLKNFVFHTLCLLVLS